MYDGYLNLDTDLASRHVLPPLDQFETQVDVGLVVSRRKNKKHSIRAVRTYANAQVILRLGYILHMYGYAKRLAIETIRPSIGTMKHRIHLSLFGTAKIIVNDL